MNNNGWITDRLPTEEDGVHINGLSGQVWAQRNNSIKTVSWVVLQLGQPWQAIHVPELYVKPKRWSVDWNHYCNCYVITDCKLRIHLYQLQSRDAAIRICDIYNEVMP